MKGWLPLAGIGLLAALAGTSLFLAGRHAAPPVIESGPVDATPDDSQIESVHNGAGFGTGMSE